MSKVGLTVAKPEWGSPLAAHFGMAKWLLIYDTETQEKEFQRNKELVGRGVVATLEKHGCADAIFSTIGPGALVHLELASIRGWYGPEHVPAHELVERLKRGELRRAEQPSQAGRGRGAEGRGRGHDWGGEGRGLGLGRGGGHRCGKGRHGRGGQRGGGLRGRGRSRNGN
jgi:predicted Fe-Mo cluster-binding NifX family protein